MILETLLAAILVMLTSLVGVFFINRHNQNFLEKNLSFLISFSAGVFFVTAGGLALEVIELASSLAVGVVLILLGYALAHIFNYLLPETHDHHLGKCELGHRLTAKKLMIADGIHNIADGIILVAAFAASPLLGVAATVSVLFHEALQEVSEFFILRKAGYSIKQSLLLNFAVSSTILIGVGLGFSALALDKLELMLLALSAGFFFYVVLHDLLPHNHTAVSSAGFIKHLFLVAFGVLLMGLVASMLSEGHSHENDESNSHSAEHLEELGENH